MFCAPNLFFSPIFCNIVDKIYDNDRKIHYGGRYADARGR